MRHPIYEIWRDIYFDVIEKNDVKGTENDI